MMIIFRKPLAALLCLLGSLLFSSLTHARDDQLGKNVILLIGDGMGEAHVKASSWFFTATEQGLAMQKLPFQSFMQTQSADSEVTDSAAAATAMGTGQKTKNGYVGRDRHAHDTRNLFELARQKGKRTGIITTVSISHATPAGFAAHADHRNQTNKIIDSLLSRSRPHILFGAATEINPEWAEFKGYEVLQNAEQLQSFRPANSSDLAVAGLFGKDSLAWYAEPQAEQPQLPELTRKALQLLETADNGFLLMIESGKLDWAAHQADLWHAVHEVKALDDSLATILDWIGNHPDTLLIVTADHETGDLRLDTPDHAKRFELPKHQWLAPTGPDGTLTHSAKPVPIYASGKGAEAILSIQDNTDIFHLLKRAL